jgi:RNA recognition motif-containing protein
MKNKLFVGNLPWSVDDAALGEAFAQYGEVTEARVARERDTGRSRGFGFVTFTADEAAEAALNALNGADLQGRNINVMFANPPKQA